MKRNFLVLLLLLTSQFAFANAGSAMLWFSFLHLIFINAFIGIAESGFLKLFNIKNKMIWIVAANYISMLAGMYLIAPFFSSIFGYSDFFGNWTKYNSTSLNGFFIGMFFAFISSLFIEYPFYSLAIGKRNRWKTTKAVIVANLISYIIMIFIYYQIIRGSGNFN